MIAHQPCFSESSLHNWQLQIDIGKKYRSSSAITYRHRLRRSFVFRDTEYMKDFMSDESSSVLVGLLLEPRDIHTPYLLFYVLKFTLSLMIQKYLFYKKYLAIFSKINFMLWFWIYCVMRKSSLSPSSIIFSTQGYLCFNLTLFYTFGRAILILNV